jgi:alpha-glucosidase
VARFWLDRGVDGFRLDVINMIVHDAELRDNPPAQFSRTPPQATQMQRHLYDRSRPEALGFVADLRALMDGYDGRMTVGEVVDDPPLPRQQEYVEPGRLHTAYGFHLLAARRATPELFTQALTSWARAAGWPSWSLGNHDVARFATRLAADDPAATRTLMAALMCLRGTIFLYQGEELGLPQGKVPFERLRDPYDIANWPGGAGRDGARTPMPWIADAPMAGFSTAAETWLPVDAAHRRLAVDRQEGDAGAMLAFTRGLVALRKATPALKLGNVRVIDAPAGVLAFERVLGDERILCVFELSGKAARFDLADAVRAVPLQLWSGALAGDAVDLGPHGGAILRLAG